MIKKITLLFLLLFFVKFFGQDIPNDQYNGFSSRSFMKFNSFLSVPTFSLLHRNHQAIEVISRSSNIQFQDASRLHILSYSGKMRDNIGAGIAIFQQEVNVFKDFGAIANYAYQIQMGAESKLTFGFNFFYSRRGLDTSKVISQFQIDDEVVNNYQDKPVVVFQPAVTYSYGNFYGGIFLENLGDFNLKESEFVTQFSEKTISAHLGYVSEFENLSGLLSETSLKVLGVARRSQLNGFSYAGNVLVDLPKAGWIKAGYDNLFGFNAGVGVNLSEKLSIGFSYEKQKNLGGTNEVGLIYTLGRTSRRKRQISEIKVVIPKSKQNPNIEKQKEEYKAPESNNISDEIRIAQDSINKLNKKVDEVLRLLKNKPEPIIIRDTIRIQTETKDTSLRRSTNTPWRRKTIRKKSSGGVGYFVAVNQFKDINKVKKALKLLKKKKVSAKYIKDPKTNYNYIYIDRFSREEDAERLVKEINSSGKKGFENDEENDLGIKLKSVSSNPVYWVKINFGNASGGQTYEEPKIQPPARVYPMYISKDVEPGYYLQVSVNGKKSFADKFVDELRADNIQADYFVNPKTGNRHIYIYKTKDRKEIIKLYNNNLNDTYYDRKVIVNIK